MIIYIYVYIVHIYIYIYVNARIYLRVHIFIYMYKNNWMYMGIQKICFDINLYIILVYKHLCIYKFIDYRQGQFTNQFNGLFTCLYINI
jgi:hypothetical protein